MAQLTALQALDGIDLAGQTAVITGASSGLGRESARALASAGAHVVLVARNAEALADTRSWIESEVPDARTSTALLDLTSLASVRDGADEIRRHAPVVHILMNNAGVMFTPFGRTADGFEMQFGTNHVGHFALTRLLTPQLVAADGARVVNLSSDAHYLSDIDLDDANWERREYNKFRSYGAAKTANILHAVELDRQLRDRGVRALAVHPGMVATDLARHMEQGDFGQIMEVAAESDNTDRVSGRQEVLTPEQGASTQVWAAASPDLADKGALYLSDCRIRDDAAPYAVDEERAGKLWELSESLCHGG